MSQIADTPPFINDPTVYNETDDVTLRCAHSGSPDPSAAMWERNNATISSLRTLTIDSIQQHDAGVYTCCIIREVAGEFVRTCSDFTITVQCEYFNMLSVYQFLVWSA